MSDKAPPKLEKPFTNRIVGHEVVAVDQLLANPYNARLHPRNQQSALAGSIDEVGYIRSVTVNQRTGHVVDGHARVTMLLRSGVESIPVEYVDLTDDEEAKALLLLDPISAMAETDKGKMLDLLNMVNSDDERIQQALSDIAAANKIDFGGGDEKDAEPQVDRAEELRVKWGVELGQMWRMASRDGKRSHYLICGDCTDKDVVGRVMGGERAGACVTDSPYGINRDGIENDDPEGLRALFDGCLKVMPIDNGVIINFQSPRLFPVWLDTSRAAGHKFERMLWMYKPNDETFPWRGWLQKSEAILLTSIGKPEFIRVDPFAHDVYSPTTLGKELDKNQGWHASVKPLAVVSDLFSRIGGAIVYEPFSGSGTTIIAAENLSRQCRAVELSPGYVAVALERCAQAFGITPELVELSG